MGTRNTPRKCPECGYRFQGNGWDGIDAHWRSQHQHIMPYGEAWPIINGGGRPSEFSDYAHSFGNVPCASQPK